jgi:hypothetical protein
MNPLYLTPEGYALEPAELAEIIAPGLATSTTPTPEQLAELGEACGIYRDSEDGWYKSAAAAGMAKLIGRCCARGVPVAVAIHLLTEAMAIGCAEYGG